MKRRSATDTKAIGNCRTKKYKRIHILDSSCGGYCFLERVSSKKANDNRSASPFSQQSLDEVPAAAPGALPWAHRPSAGQTADSLMVHTMAECQGFMFCLSCSQPGANSRHYLWAPTRLQQPTFVAEGEKMGPNPNLTEVSEENTNCCCFFRAFQVNHVSISWGFLNTSQALFTIFSHCNSFLNLRELEQVTARWTRPWVFRHQISPWTYTQILQ